MTKKGSTMPIHLPELTEATRAYIYRVALAVIPILVAYGAISQNVAPLIVGLVAALFPAGLAVKNTSTAKK